MELRHRRGAKLIVRLPRQQQRCALLHRFQIHLRQTAGLPIAGKAVFDVHGRIVHQPRPDHGLQRPGMEPVGIQLHRIAQRLYLLQQRRQLRPQQRLSAGEGHAIQQPPALFQKGQQRFPVQLRRRRSAEQPAVMAEGAAQVAAAQKDRAGHPAGKIQQRHLLQPVNFHQSIPFPSHGLFTIHPSPFLCKQLISP